MSSRIPVSSYDPIAHRFGMPTPTARSHRAGMTAAEAAAQLGAPEAALERLSNCGAGPRFVQLPEGRFYPPDAVADYAARMAAERGGEA